MQIDGFDHVNIRTRDVAAAAAFYTGVLGLTVGDGPAPFPPEQVQWLYDCGGRAVLHLFRFDTEPAATGPIHHIAFTCSNKAEAMAALKAQGVDFAMNENVAANLTQIFLRDLDGILIELNFAEI